MSVGRGAFVAGVVRHGAITSGLVAYLAAQACEACAPGVRHFGFRGFEVRLFRFPIRAHDRLFLFVMNGVAILNALLSQVIGNFAAQATEALFATIQHFVVGSQLFRLRSCLSEFP